MLVILIPRTPFDFFIGPCKGTLVYHDVAPDADGEYEARLEVDRSTPPSARFLIDEYIRSSVAGLQPEVKRKIGSFVEAFNSIE